MLFVIGLQNTNNRKAGIENGYAERCFHATDAQIQAQNAQAAAQVAQQAAIQAGSHSGFALGGLFGSIAAAVSNQQAAKAVQASAATPVVASAEEVNAAGQRKTHLTRLFKQQKCKVKDLVK